MASRLRSVGLLALLVGLTGCQMQAGDSSLRLSIGRQADEFLWEGRLGEGQTIEVRGVNGDVTATVTTGSQASISAVRRGMFDDPEDVRIEIVEHAGGITACAIYPTDREPYVCAPGNEGRIGSRNSDVKVDFDIEVPAGVGLVARVVNGRIEGRSLDSDVTARTVNGSINIRTSRFAEAQTVNGRVTISMGRAIWRDEASIETVNGPITVQLPPDTDADIEIRTTNGRIVSELPLTIRESDRRRLNGTLGAGGRTLSITTVNGGVDLKPID